MMSDETKPRDVKIKASFLHETNKTHVNWMSILSKLV